MITINVVSEKRQFRGPNNNNIIVSENNLQAEGMTDVLLGEGHHRQFLRKIQGADTKDQSYFS